MWLSNFQGNSSTLTEGEGCAWSQRNQVEGCPAVGSMAVSKPLQLRPLPHRMEFLSNSSLQKLWLLPNFNDCHVNSFFVHTNLSILFSSITMPCWIYWALISSSLQICTTLLPQTPHKASFLCLGHMCLSNQAFLVCILLRPVSVPAPLVVFLLLFPALHRPTIKIVFFPESVFPHSCILQMASECPLQFSFRGVLLVMSCVLFTSLSVLLLCPNLLWNSSLCLLCPLQV